MKHTPEFEKLMGKAGIGFEELEPALKGAMQRFNQCLYLMEQRGPDAEQRLWEVLIKADAVLTSTLYHKFKERMEPAKMDKIKQMALKAKALKAKWNTHA